MCPCPAFRLAATGAARGRKGLDMVRRRYGDSDDSFHRLYEIGGADMALRYHEMRQASEREAADKARREAELRAKEQVEREAARQQASTPASATPLFEVGDLLGCFGLLQRQVDGALPGLAPDQRQGLGAVMDRLGRLVEQGTQPSRSLDTMLQQRQSLDELMVDFLPRVARPTLLGPGAPASSRPGQLMAWLQALKLYVGQAGMAPNAGPGAQAVAMDLFTRIARLTTQLSLATTDAVAIQRLEREEARGLAARVAAFARRRLVLLAQPVWGVCNLAADANALFFSGPAAARQALGTVAGARGLTLDQPQAPGSEFAARRWRDLRRAQLAVFDLAGADPQVCYELGMALATGMSLVLVAPHGELLPFDIEQNVHRYGRGARLETVLAEAVDQGLYHLQVQPGAESTLAATLDHVAALAAAQGPLGLSGVMLTALRAAGTDAGRFMAALRPSNSLFGATEHEILLTRWPGRYPETTARRWFAVMPFRAGPEQAYAKLAARVRQLSPAVQSVRGDEAPGQHIVHSIWDEICRAHMVSVDLSDFNPNVCLELGMAHTLGKPTLLYGADGCARELQARLPGVAKWRLHPYSAGAQLAASLLALPTAATRDAAPSSWLTAIKRS